MKNKLLVVFLFFTIIFCCYSNILESSWHLDDKPNILDNPAVHIETLTYDALLTAFLSLEGHKNYRPLPNLSFAINWYISGADPSGYHFVNIMIHVFSAVFLLLSFLVIFESPNLKYHFTKDDAFFISCLAAVLWALNPVQTQAVTYIVQRMTGMAAMFYIAAIFFYVKSRNLALKRDLKYILCYAICCLCCLCAFMSKENAFLLPLSFLLAEIMFFRDLSQFRISRRKTALSLIIAACLAFIIIIVFVNGNAVFFIKGYDLRPFSLWNRILTEPRIVIYYLSQIFYPLPERLSIAHDVTVSESLFNPWTTFPAILTVFVLIISGIYHSRKSPILVFALLFYFLNHLVESTVIPLELLFEHRSYLPSMFIFLPVAALVNHSLNIFRQKNLYVYTAIIMTVIVVIIWFGISTYNRNSAWYTELSLWYDAYSKHPNNARTASSLAVSLGFRDNATLADRETALKLLEKSLSLSKSHKYMNAEIYGNMAGLNYTMGRFEKSLELHRKSLEVNPGFVKGRFDLVKNLVMTGNFDEASKEMDIIFLYDKVKTIPDFFKVKGHILLWQNQPLQALDNFRKAFRMAPWNHDIFHEIGRALSMAGSYRNAEWFLRQYQRENSLNINASLCLIENSIKLGDMVSAEKYAADMLAKNSIMNINNTISTSLVAYQDVPVSSEIIKPVVIKKIWELSGLNTGKMHN